MATPQETSILTDARRPGGLLFHEFIDAGRIRLLRDQVAAADLPWRPDAHSGEHSDADSMEATHAHEHEVVALKRALGDMSVFGRLFSYESIEEQIKRQVAEHVADGDVPLLPSWNVDEVILRRRSREVGVPPAYRKFDERFAGVIAVLGIEGRATVFTKLSPDAVVPAEWQIEPGTLLITRAHRLTDEPVEQRLWHGVGRLQTDTFSSIVLRANTTPSEEIADYPFANWDADSYPLEPAEPLPTPERVPVTQRLLSLLHAH